MSELIAVQSTPAAISVNYEEVRAWLTKELVRFDVVVTEDSLSDAKKLATELNQSAGDFDNRRKAAVEQVSGPIKEFDTQMKSLVQQCKDGRQKILDQIKKFEDKTRELAKTSLQAFLGDTWDSLGVKAEFRRAVIADLVKLTALTKKSKLTAASMKSVEARANTDYQLQQQTEMRLLTLENQSYKAGLAAPLTRAHVESFLFADEPTYKNALSAMITSELDRQKVSDERARQQVLAEQERTQQKATPPQEPEQREQVPSNPSPAPVPDRKVEPAPQTATQVSQQQQQQQQQAMKFAVGLLSDPANATIMECSPVTAKNHAIDKSMTLDTVGVWVPSGLVGIAYQGDFFKKQSESNNV